jgi:poly-gamma-glutamate capsule biosynthesis protein CapA/YwtB (metallophosphatase superfamily)
MAIRPDPTATGPQAVMRLFLCGDVMTGRGVDQVLPHPGDPRLHERWAKSAEDYVLLAERRNGPIPRPADDGYVWGEALDVWRDAAADVRIANLETSITRGDEYAPKGINYRMAPANLGCLVAAGFDCCVLANNHVLDWGRAGLLDTLDALAGVGIKTAGAGRDTGRARAPAVLDVAGKGRVLVIGLGAPGSGIPGDWSAGPRRPGVNLTDLSAASARTIVAALAPVRRPGDIVVASVHWGPNWGYEVPEAQRAFAHALIEIAGVAVVHGHSSHHPKAIEVHHDRLILYGCGDFLNDYEGIEGEEAFRPDLTLMYFADLARQDGSLVALGMTPMKIRRFQLARASAEDADWLEAALDGQARRFGGQVARVGDRLALSWPRTRRPAQDGQGWPDA